MSTFIIIEEGRFFAPTTVNSAELLMGSAPECGLRLQHPSIPTALAGIRHVNKRYRFFPLRDPISSPAQAPVILLNGRELTGDIALADGDEIVVAGYHLNLSEEGQALVINVSYVEQEGMALQHAKRETSHPADSRAADDVMGAWIKRHLWKTREKVSRATYLRPTPQKVPAGTEFNWAPTRDLARPWPIRLVGPTSLVIFVIAAVFFFVRPSIFAPAAVSYPHAIDKLTLFPQIAAIPNSGSCRSCHQFTAAIAENCAQCHQSNGFLATITLAHQAAGLTCITCHTEHQGENFSPKAQAFKSCAGCHNDENKKTYNGKSVHRPHDGTFGYPTAGGKWVWPGLSEEALKLKPEVISTQSSEFDEQTWRRVQFHALHLYRVKVTGNLTGVEDGVLSCSSCHKEFFGKFDRETPRQTCPVCHTGYTEDTTKRVFVDAGKPNCTSCHVEHLYDAYRWGDLLTEPAYEKRQRAIDKRYLDAVKRSALLP